MAVGESGTILSSWDFGNTWNHLDSPTSDELVKVKCPEKDEYVFIQSEDHIWRAQIDVVTNIEVKEVSVNDLDVWPNPAGNHITISTKNSEYQIECLSIYDSMGNCKRKVYCKDAFVNIDCSSLNYGIYVLEVQTSDSYFFEKIIIQ
jgi:hypothetical protein